MSHLAAISTIDRVDSRQPQSLNPPRPCIRLPSDLTPFFLLQMYSKMVQRCFDDCVNDFTTKSLINREEQCIMRCVDKHLKGSARLQERFQEQNAAMMQGGQPGR